MARRNDTRERIIRAARTLMRRRGYTATSVSDVVAASDAPRGSITHHFPGGKEEMAIEVIELMTRDILDQVDRAAATSHTPREVLTTQIREIGEGFTLSGFIDGCPIVPLTIELGEASEPVRQSCQDFFTAWRTRLTGHLTDTGLPPARAARLADLTVCSVEGALVIARAEKNLNILDQIAEDLAAMAESP